MELQNYIPQLGFAGIFALAVIKLYKDMRSDSEKRDEESKEREEKLMEHLDKQADINKEVSDTLKNIHDRLCNLEVE